MTAVSRASCDSMHHAGGRISWASVLKPVYKLVISLDQLIWLCPHLNLMVILSFYIIASVCIWWLANSKPTTPCLKKLDWETWW